MTARLNGINALRNVATVPRVMFGRGSAHNVRAILEPQRKTASDRIVFIVDEHVYAHGLTGQIHVTNRDVLIRANVTTEPGTDYVDSIVSELKSTPGGEIVGVVGYGGGSTLDIAKAVSLMLTNPGSAADYQGWDLIKNKAVYHLGVPTLSGSGSEVSRTAVLIGPEQKLGLNSDYTVFDQVVLDPELSSSAPRDQRFFTAMDCYIHCVESMRGTFRNTFSDAMAAQARLLCEEAFIEGGNDADEKLTMASYLGGLSIAYSQVGIVHALSYGLSFVLKTRHAVANCIILNALQDFFPDEIKTFRRMADAAEVDIPSNIAKAATDVEIATMVDVALRMVPLWQHQFGSDWETVATRATLTDIYRSL